MLKFKFKLVMSFAETAQTIELPKFDGPILPLSNLANFPYSRRDMENWYKEINPIVNNEIQLKLDLFGSAPPKFELFGADDSDSICRLREFYAERHNRFVAILNTTNLNGFFNFFC